MPLSRERIQDYLDDTLSAEEKLNVEVTIAQDTELALQIARMRAVNSAIDLVGTDQLEAALPQEIVRALNKAMTTSLDADLPREQQSSG